jgi:hypothetical protein
MEIPMKYLLTTVTILTIVCTASAGTTSTVGRDITGNWCLPTGWKMYYTKVSDKDYKLDLTGKKSLPCDDLIEIQTRGIVLSPEGVGCDFTSVKKSGNVYHAKSDCHGEDGGCVWKTDYMMSAAGKELLIKKREYQVHQC